jgi:hypothetical protein
MLVNGVQRMKVLVQLMLWVHMEEASWCNPSLKVTYVGDLIQLGDCRSHDSGLSTGNGKISHLDDW